LCSGILESVRDPLVERKHGNRKAGKAPGDDGISGRKERP